MNVFRRLLIVLGVLIVAGALACLVLIVAAKQGKQGTGYSAGSVLAGHLAVAIHTQSPVNLATIQNFNFPWDRVYFFSSYTTREVVEQRLGASPGWNWSSLTQATEGYTLIVFKQGNRVVAFFDFPNEAGDFSAAAKVTAGFSAREARFTVIRNPPNRPEVIPLVR